MESGDGSIFSFMFVGREITESKVFKARETNIAQIEASKDASKGVGSNGVSEQLNAQAKVTTGGNTLKKTSQDKYRSIATTDFDAAFNEVLTGMGFETVDYADVLSNCGGASINSIKNAFSARPFKASVPRPQPILGD